MREECAIIGGGINGLSRRSQGGAKEAKQWSEVHSLSKAQDIGPDEQIARFVAYPSHAYRQRGGRASERLRGRGALNDSV